MTTRAEEILTEPYFEYLKIRGYDAEKIPETTTETPDFKVSKGSHVFLNEFKAPELIMDPVTHLFKFKTTISKLLRTIHKAVNQLEAHDPGHKSPWIVTFTSSHFQLNWKSFVDSLQGAVVFNGQTAADFRQTAVFRNVKDDIMKADLYIWLQVNADNKFCQATLIQTDTTKYKNLIGQMTVDLSNKKVSYMDNIFLLELP